MRLASVSATAEAAARSCDLFLVVGTSAVGGRLAVVHDGVGRHEPAPEGGEAERGQDTQQYGGSGERRCIEQIGADVTRHAADLLGRVAMGQMHLDAEAAAATLPSHLRPARAKPRRARAPSSPKTTHPRTAARPAGGAVVACRDGFFLVGQMFVAALLPALLMARGATKR